MKLKFLKYMARHRNVGLCLLLSVCVMLFFQAQAAHQNNEANLTKITVSMPNGEHVNKVTIFIGDKDENITHAVRNSSSFTKDTYGDNYCAYYDQKNEVEAQIAALPKDTPVNLVGYGLGGATAAWVAVDLAHIRPINVLVTLAPSGNHPDFAVIKSSVTKWIDIKSK